MKYQAYWLNINGTVIPVETIHITTVIKTPERFGYSLERIHKIYKKNGEPMGHEGRARVEIMSDLIKRKGWIRFRFKPKEDSWTVELNTLTTDVMERIKEFFKHSEVVGKSKNADIRITELFHPDGMKRHNIPLTQLLNSESGKQNNEVE